MKWGGPLHGPRDSPGNFTGGQPNFPGNPLPGKFWAFPGIFPWGWISREMDLPGNGFPEKPPGDFPGNDIRETPREISGEF